MSKANNDKQMFKLQAESELKDMKGAQFDK